MTRDEATIIARHIAAGAQAMRGTGEDYCQFMRDGAYDDDPIVQATIAALTMDDEYKNARLAEIRKAKAGTNVVEIAA